MGICVKMVEPWRLRKSCTAFLFEEKIGVQWAVSHMLQAQNEVQIISGWASP